MLSKIRFSSSLAATLVLALAQAAVFPVCGDEGQVACDQEYHFAVFAKNSMACEDAEGYEAESGDCAEQNGKFLVLQISWNDCEKCEKPDQATEYEVGFVSVEKLQTEDW